MYCYTLDMEIHQYQLDSEKRVLKYIGHKQIRWKPLDETSEFQLSQGIR